MKEFLGQMEIVDAKLPRRGFSRMGEAALLQLKSRSHPRFGVEVEVRAQILHSLSLSLSHTLTHTHPHTLTHAITRT